MLTDDVNAYHTLTTKGCNLEHDVESKKAAKAAFIKGLLKIVFPTFDICQ